MTTKWTALVLACLAFATTGCTDDGGGPAAPARTSWAPVGARTVGSYDYSVIPRPDAFHTMHSSVTNSDNVWIAVAPMMEFAWVAEPTMYVSEGPSFDNEGNLYFSPLWPMEDVSLVSLDAETGARNWALPGDGYNGGGGAPLILNDPDNPGEQIIYNGTYEDLVAVRPDGTIVWQDSTGLTLPVVVPGVRSDAHVFGVNYHPQTDSILGITSRGQIYAHDRLTGAPIAPIGQVPGSAAAVVDHGLPQGVIDASNAVSDAAFGQTPEGGSYFEVVLNAVFGGGAVVTNYFGIDPNTGRIYAAATADDAADGTVDGISELGALYLLELTNPGGGLQFSVVTSTTFVGGTGSTPTISEDGSRVFVSDNLGNVIALDATDLGEIWRFDVGEQLVASVAVSPDNAEIYVVTRHDIFKLIDQGGSATLAWTATLDAFADDPSVEIEVNTLTPSITANGIAVSIGGGRSVLGQELLTKMGVGLLDRETGTLRAFTVGREESISITSVAPNGGVCTGNSPVRRFGAVALLPDEGQPITGGISCYRPARSDILARDASCAASARAANAATIAASAPDSANEDILQIQTLIDQTRDAAGLALTAGNLSTAAAANVESQLVLAEASLAVATLGTAASELSVICEAL